MAVPTRVTLVVAPTFNRKMPHLGLCALRAYLKERGYETRYLDLSALHVADPLLAPCIPWLSARKTEPGMTLYTSVGPVLKALRTGDLGQVMPLAARMLFHDWVSRFSDRILADKPDVVGFSIYESNFAFSVAIAQKIKEKDSTVVLVFGGPYLVNQEIVRVFAEIPNAIDYFVLGEAEHSMTGLVRYVSGEIRRFPDSCVSTTDPSTFSAEPSSIADLDALPFPDYSDVPIDAYRGNTQVDSDFTRCVASAGEFLLPVAFGRGCPFRCSFCGHSPASSRSRIRSVERVLEEIHTLHDTHGCRVFRMNDSLINVNKRWLHDFCDALIASSLGIYFYGHARASGLDRDLAAKLHRAGCRYVKFGLESGSDRMLRIMNKAATSGQQEAGLRAAHEAGLKTRVSFIYNFPGERREDLEQTLEFTKRNADYIDSFRSSETVMVPESDLALHPETYNIATEDFGAKSPEGKAFRWAASLPRSWRSYETDEDEMRDRKAWFAKAMGDVSSDLHRPYWPTTFPEIVQKSLDTSDRLQVPENLRGRWRDNQVIARIIEPLVGETEKRLLRRLEEKPMDFEQLATGEELPRAELRRAVVLLMSVGLLQTDLEDRR